MPRNVPRVLTANTRSHMVMSTSISDGYSSPCRVVMPALFSRPSDAPEAFLRLPRHPERVLLRRHVDAQRQHLRALGLAERRRLREVGDVGERQLRPLLRQPRRVPAPQPRRRTRHDDDPVLQQHRTLLAPPPAYAPSYTLADYVISSQRRRSTTTSFPRRRESSVPDRAHGAGWRVGPWPSPLAFWERETRFSARVRVATC